MKTKTLLDGSIIVLCNCKAFLFNLLLEDTSGEDNFDLIERRVVWIVCAICKLKIGELDQNLVSKESETKCLDD